jgi:hypothetical protein
MTTKIQRPVGDTARAHPGASGADLSNVSGKYLSLTTFRRDGSPVATPVWFVRDFDRLLVETEADSYKVRRIRANAHVTVATCSARGRVKGPAVEARAEILSDLERPRAERLLAHKYRIDGLIIRPIRWVQMALHLGKRRGVPVIVSVAPESAPNESGLQLAA